MDDKRCSRSYFPCLPTPGLRLDPVISDKKKKCVGNYRRKERKHPGDIVYVKNPLFESVKPFNSLPRSSNRVLNTNDGIPQIFFPSLEYRYNKATSSQHLASDSKSRKHRMKARAESRRDSLIELSSDEDYSSSVNSSSDPRHGSNSSRNSSNMEEYNRRSRSARTERYFRRLSKEENFHETYDFNTPVLTRNNQGVVSNFQKETHLFSPPPPPRNYGSVKERKSPNLLFYKRDNADFHNPVTDTSVFNFNRRFDKRQEIPEKRGVGLFSSVKNEPKTRETVRENKTDRQVRRSYSFQSQVPRKPQESGRMERKWIDSIASSASTNSNPLSSGDFPRRKLSSTNPFSDMTEDKTPPKQRSSKDFRKELSELEKLYTSLRLSDDNLLERAEERCIEENSLKGLKSKNETLKYLTGSSSESISDDGNLKGEKSEADVVNDDMAYRKMQSKRMPALSETQNSLSQISYLLASSALILDKSNDYADEKVDEEPNITKDDVVYRNLHYANNVLKVVEPQPPFGIPLRPATPSTNSNYLCSSPVALKSPPLKFVPQSEPNLVTDDLAFRNLRKDAPKTPPPLLSGDNEGTKEVDVSLLKNEFDKPLSDDIFFRKKKRAVRSLSANLYGLINDVKSLELNIK